MNTTAEQKKKTHTQGERNDTCKINQQFNRNVKLGTI